MGGGSYTFWLGASADADPATHEPSRVTPSRPSGECPLHDALREIVQWADAYPVRVFPEPDLKAVQNALVNAKMLKQMDRMHASWARHLLSGVGGIARAALAGDAA